jgi:hypothetical protein
LIVIVPDTAIFPTVTFPEIAADAEVTAPDAVTDEPDTLPVKFPVNAVEYTLLNLTLLLPNVTVLVVAGIKFPVIVWEPLVSKIVLESKLAAAPATAASTYDLVVIE